MSSVVAPLDQRKVYGVVPPVTVRSAEPSLAPWQLTSIFEIEVLRSCDGF